MKNYIDTLTKEIYAYESDGSQDAYIKNGLVPISDTDLAILRAPTLPQAVDAKRAQLTQAYSTAIQRPVAYMSTTFQADTASQQVLTASIAAGAVPTGFAWLDANNVAVPMTYAELQGLAGAMLARGYAAFQNLQTKKASAASATSVIAVQAIVF
jgi:hypothetical protein